MLIHLVLFVHPEVVALFVKLILEALISLLVDKVKLATAHIKLVLLTMADLIQPLLRIFILGSPTIDSFLKLGLLFGLADFHLLLHSKES